VSYISSVNLLHVVRFQVLTAASMKFRVVWDVAPCSHVEVSRRFRGAYCVHHQGDDDGGSTHLWNVGQLQCDYKALHPRRLNFYKLPYATLSIILLFCQFSQSLKTYSVFLFQHPSEVSVFMWCFSVCYCLSLFLSEYLSFRTRSLVSLILPVSCRFFFHLLPILRRSNPTIDGHLLREMSRRYGISEVTVFMLDIVSERLTWWEFLHIMPVRVRWVDSLEEE
jgi:hypothetical protein